MIAFEHSHHEKSHFLLLAFDLLDDRQQTHDASKCV